MNFESSLAHTLATLQQLTEIRPQIDAAGTLILDTLRAGNKLLICGNGGSAAEAQHFATELVGRYKINRRGLPAVALTSDGTLASCIANDFGWDSVFSRQLSALAQPGDLFIGITTSGQSPNVLAGLEEAKKRGLSSLALLGKGGGRCRGLATVDVIIPGDLTAPIQECHLFLIHHFCERIDEAFPS